MSKDKLLLFFLGLTCFLGLLAPNAWSSNDAESEIVGFVKQMYRGEEIQVTFSQLPAILRGAAKVKNISFSRVPTSAGEGICLVGVEGKSGFRTTVYVPFRVLIKRTLYGLKEGLKKGENIGKENLVRSETFLQGSAAAFPEMDDLIGRSAKKDMASGEIITRQLLEERIAIAKGETVNMTLENQRLFVQAKGVALEKGRVGDVIRVKSSSGREIFGKVTGKNNIIIGF
jgi:flagellar basal body P-ring formation protein FlgA